MKKYKSKKIGVRRDRTALRRSILDISKIDSPATAVIPPDPDSRTVKVMREAILYSMEPKVHSHPEGVGPATAVLPTDPDPKPRPTRKLSARHRRVMRSVKLKGNFKNMQKKNW